MDIQTVAAKLIRLGTKISEGVGDVVSNPDLEARIDRLAVNLGPYGVDPFGFDPEYVKKWIGVFAAAYRHYFRCQSFGVENIPDGGCLCIANHSGQLPFDAAMISVAALLEREPPRFIRSMLERFVPKTPFVSTFMARFGQILGTPANCRRVLEAGDAILVFPEGVGGLNKTWSRRYRLQRFGQGFMRLALESGAPIVPVAVIGAEEQAPALYNARVVGKLVGMPAFPVTPTNPLLPGLGLVPYPTRYRIYFGEPIELTGDANDEDELIVAKVDMVKQRIQQMIDDGLAAREHVFW